MVTAVPGLTASGVSNVSLLMWLPCCYCLPGVVGFTAVVYVTTAVNIPCLNVVLFPLSFTCLLLASSDVPVVSRPAASPTILLFFLLSTSMELLLCRAVPTVVNRYLFFSRRFHRLWYLCCCPLLLFSGLLLMWSYRCWFVPGLPAVS
jgi:hypothetical protein